MREWLELKGLQDWTNQANTDGVKIDYRSSTRGFNTLRASAVLPFNIMDIFVTLMDAKSRPLYDVNIDDTSHTISRIAANTTAIYQKSKKIFVVSSRDFVLVSHLHRHANGDISIIAFSDESIQHLVPENKNAVRGCVHLAGWHLEILSKASTRCTLIIELDLKGNLPQFAIKGANVEQGSQLKKIPKIIRQYLQERGRTPITE